MGFRLVHERPIGTLSYALFLPQGEPPPGGWPLIMFLHDADMGGNDARLQTTQGLGPVLLENPQAWPCTVYMPQALQGQSWEGDNLERAYSLLNRLTQAYRANPKRIYLTGIGLGGHGVWNLALRQPRSFAALAPICGGADPVQASKILHQMPIWAFHGSDDPLIPVNFSRAMSDAFKGSGSTHFRYTEYAGVGHSCWEQAYREPEFIAWLFAQHRV